MMILEAVAEGQEETTEAEAKVREAEENQTAKVEVANLGLIVTTGRLRVLVEAGVVAAITKGSRATITPAVDILQAAIQTGFDIH